MSLPTPGIKRSSHSSPHPLNSKRLKQPEREVIASIGEYINSLGKIREIDVSLIKAVESKNETEIRSLLESGANMDAIGYEGLSAVGIAERMNISSLLKIFTQFKAQPTLKIKPSSLFSTPQDLLVKINRFLSYHDQAQVLQVACDEDFRQSVKAVKQEQERLIISYKQLEVTDFEIILKQFTGTPNNPSHLKKLDFDFDFELKDKHIEFVADNFPKLEFLGGKLVLSDQGLIQVGRLTYLKKLVLHFDRRRMTDSGLANLAKLTQLEDLDFRDSSDLTDAGLMHIANLFQLRVLSLFECKQITNEGLKCFTNLVNLESLSLFNVSQIDDDGLKNLQRLTNLQYLDLYGTYISNTGLEQLSNYLFKIKHLILVKCSISDEGLPHLLNFEHLEELCLYLGGGITPQGLRNANLNIHASLKRIICSQNAEETEEGAIIEEGVEYLKNDWTNIEILESFCEYSD